MSVACVASLLAVACSDETGSSGAGGQSGSSGIGGSGGEAGAVPRTVVSYPSTDFSSLQEAIDAAPAGATVEIDAGIYELSEPITIAGKHLVLAGNGARGEERTELKGPVPDLSFSIATPEQSIGVLNFTGEGSADVYDMAFKGFDAAIIVPMPAVDSPGLNMEIRNVTISETIRGITLEGPQQHW